MKPRGARLLASWLALLICSAAGAHEFWALPDAFDPAPGSAVSVTLSVGEQFEGERVGLRRAQLLRVLQVDGGGTRDLTSRMPLETVGALPFRIEGAGAHLVVIDTNPSFLELSADKFHAYLHEEGLDDVVKLREANGTATQPGREAFRRNVKTLMRTRGADAAAAPAVLQPTGQVLELVPLADPTQMRAGEDFAVRVLFEGRPLANRLVKFWNRRGVQTLVIRVFTDNEGRAAATLPFAGTWMTSVVHMAPARKPARQDWDSWWGNLTFRLP